MRYIVVENGVVVNVVLADEEFASTQGWIQSDVGETGQLYSDGTLNDAPEDFDPSLYPLTAAQIRVVLRRNGISMATIDGLIAAIPDDDTREDAQLYWEFSPYIHYENPVTQLLLPLANLTLDQIKTMWKIAKDL